ncbi:hypothetical protein E2562_034250 [Oryza meyeriana var. granulata]|uniref:Uncharacterized protein n=1 Tax=Oryza meyeriana var. granulata TaxID=110450 RepID=A0A6G1CB35_9ORYZ|nr:hypothetical protein E2562_034250 [Oryza meyeriana var. granulata]
MAAALQYWKAAENDTARTDGEGPATAHQTDQQRNRHSVRRGQAPHQVEQQRNGCSVQLGPAMKHCWRRVGRSRERKRGWIEVGDGESIHCDRDGWADPSGQAQECSGIGGANGTRVQQRRE